jgi:hypothetical protein
MQAPARTGVWTFDVLVVAKPWQSAISSSTRLISARRPSALFAPPLFYREVSMSRAFWCQCLSHVGTQVP